MKKKFIYISLKKNYEINPFLNNLNDYFRGIPYWKILIFTDHTEPLNAIRRTHSASLVLRVRRSRLKKSKRFQPIRK